MPDLKNKLREVINNPASSAEEKAAAWKQIESLGADSEDKPSGGVGSSAQAMLTALGKTSLADVADEEFIYYCEQGGIEWRYWSQAYTTDAEALLAEWRRYRAPLDELLIFLELGLPQSDLTEENRYGARLCYWQKRAALAVLTIQAEDLPREKAYPLLDAWKHALSQIHLISETEAAGDAVREEARRAARGIPIEPGTVEAFWKKLDALESTWKQMPHAVLYEACLGYRDSVVKSPIPNPGIPNWPRKETARA